MWIICHLFEANHISVCITFHLVHYLNKSVFSAHYFWFEACQICQMCPELHCTIALGPCPVSIHFLFSNKEWELHWLPMQRNSTHILHAWTLPLHCAKVFSSWSDFGNLMPPTREQEEFFSSFFTFTPASLAGWQLCTAGTDRNATLTHRLWEQLNTC